MADGATETWLLLGTSNTIGEKGYRRFLPQLRPDVTLRVAGVGDSPSQMLAYALDGLPLKGVDRVVIDTLVNDAAQGDAGLLDPLACERSLFEAVRWLTGQGLPVCLLLMPLAKPSALARALRQRRIEWARANGVAHVDGAGIVCALRRDFGLDDARLFVDPLHGAWPVTLLLARRLARLELPRRAAAFGHAPPPGSVVRLAPDHAPRITRSTRLLTADYAVLAPGVAARIDLPAPATLFALAINRLRTPGRVVVTAESGMVVLDPVRVAAQDLGSPRGIIHVVAAIHPALHGRRFTLTAVAPPDGAAAEAEVEAAIFRTAGAPEAGLWTGVETPLDAAGPDAPEALPAEETALALAATMAAGNAAVEQAAEIFRTRIASDRPLWTRRPAQAARVLARLGEALGEAAAAERVRRSGEEDGPDPGGADAGRRRRRG